MQKTKIAKTDIEVSILGLGTVKFGRNTAVKYPTPFIIPSDRQVIDILNTSAECGINLLDTAPAYGNSEQRLGNLLKKTNHHWVVSTKVGEIFDSKTGTSSYNFTPEFIQKSIENSLKVLQLEQLDIVLVHSNGDDEKIIYHDGALETLNHLKQKGLIRASGMSTKTAQGGIMAASQADVIMVTHNITYQEEVNAINYAAKHNKAVFIKKAFASGNNTSSNPGEKIPASFDCIFQHAGISSVILGSINPKHIKQNMHDAIESLKKIPGVTLE
jgi:aryl-alcohol dehydrogenase-like predicted oxidoreductase